LAALVVGFAAAAALIRPQALPPAAGTGWIVALIAALFLGRPKTTILPGVCGGFLAALWSALLQIQGLPRLAALTVAGIVAATSVYLATKRASFAPDALKQEAMLVMIVLGLAVAVIPEISAGWQSALALNREERNSAEQIIANWVLVLSAVSVVLGGLYSLLRRR
jgi:hypothetical protein